LLTPLAVWGQECIIPRDRHPWAAFRPGSWKLVKVTAETFDAAGKSTGTSITETRTMLLSVEATRYELQIDVKVDVGGKQFASLPRVTQQGFQGEGEGQKANVRRLAASVLKIGERSLNAQNAEIEVADKESRKVTRISYSGSGHPFVLARQSTTYDATGKVQQEVDVETKAMQAPRTLLGVRRMTWQTRTTQKHAGGRIVTDEVHCFDIPGGVVEHTSEEFDEQGKLLRRSQLELANYGIATAEKPLQRRKQPRKSRR
jgi:hypothetical protein